MHEANKPGLSAETQPHSVGHNTELTCNVAQAAPSVINTTYHPLKSGHKLTTLRAPRGRSRRRRPHSQRSEPDSEDRDGDDAHSVASCPGLVSYYVNRCLGPVIGRPRRQWRGYVLRGLDNNAGFETRVMGANARDCQNGASMSSANCQWLRGGQQVDDRAYSGGNTLGWVGDSSTGDRGGRAHVRQHSGVVGVARGRIPVEVTKLSPVYNLFSLSQTFFLVFLCTHCHKGGNRVCIAASRM
jgi:hypothetical protein